MTKIILNPKAFYLPGDVITYNVTFSNVGNGSAFGMNIQDALPGAVTYSASSIMGTKATFGKQTVGGILSIYYTNFILNP